jgi:hypothetical protein
MPRLTALKKNAWRQELFGAGHKLAPGIVFQRETRQAANKAVQKLLDGLTMNPKLLLGYVLFLSGCLFGCFNVVLSAAETVSTNYPSGSLTINYTNAHGMVTQKTIRTESTNAKESITYLATNYVNFLSSITNVEQTNLTSADKALAAYMLTNAALSVMTNAAFMAEFAEIGHAAGMFFDDLKAQGRLPGISKGSHGDAITDDLSESDSCISQKIKYPYLLTFHVVLTGDSLTNHYTVMQPSKDSVWQLLRAWRTDAEGHVIKEWPIK